MKAIRCLASAGALLLPLLLSGCFILSTTRKLPIPKPPSMVNTVAPEQLVEQLNRRWAALNSLNATVDIQASVLKTKEGVARDYTSFRGIILMRKPEMLRVFGRLPVIGTRMFDMVSDGKVFTLYIPSRNKVVKGANALKKRSSSQVENMRPGFFFDAMLVRGLEPGDLYAVTAETDTLADATKKHLYIVPEYVISIMRSNPGSKQLTPVRVITIHRDDLLPYEQDLYDSEGDLETQVTYAEYREFGSSRYPSTVTIKRPLEEYQIVLTVENVQENQPLTDDQFQINNIPAGTVTQQLE
jgi:outer membrane lipoprotein-sorting protein